MPVKNSHASNVFTTGPIKNIHAGGEPIWSKSHGKGICYPKVLHIFHSTTWKSANQPFDSVGWKGNWISLKLFAI